MKLTATSLALALLLSACNGNNTLVTKPADYALSSGDIMADGSGRHAAFAALYLRTNAPSITITGTTAMPEKYVLGAIITVMLGNTCLQQLHFAKPGKATFEVEIPGTGERTVRLVEGVQFREAEAGELRGTVINSVSTPAGTTARFIQPPKTKEAFVCFSDSRGFGGGYQEAALYAWPVQVARRRQANLYQLGYSGLQLGAHIGTPAGRAALTRAVTSHLRGYESGIVYVQGGVNDYSYASYIPAQLTGFLRLWLRELKQAVPTARLVVETDGPKADTTANRLGFTLQHYRDAERAGADSLAQVVDGRRLWTLDDLEDGTHLTIPGDSRRVIGVQQALAR